MKLFKNPLFTFFFSTALTLVIWLLSTKEKKPSYHFSNPLIIANTSENDELNYYWNNKKINNLKEVYLTIWNDGRSYIDFNDFSDSMPLTVLSNSDEIYKATIFKKSRKDLNASTKIIRKDSIKSIEIKFEGEDALEKNDGLQLSILYSSKTDINWELKGRVKGAKNGYGFEPVLLKESNYSMLSNYITLILFLIVLIRVITSLIKSNTVKFKSWEIVFISCYIIYLYVLPFLFYNSFPF